MRMSTNHFTLLVKSFHKKKRFRFFMTDTSQGCKKSQPVTLKQIGLTEESARARGLPAEDGLGCNDRPWIGHDR